ncbi:MAG TPA: fused MFS/spermidine synthase [Vicinamibacterales bacterium]|nr:fused MFS/spermidine synthase [Vicinamibacterales bacterium]
MIAQLLFLTAYGCSGLAGLIYEVSWTRLLTLYMGHSTAAASAVVAAFMGGLAVGAAGGGRLTRRLTREQCLKVYIGLEAFVVVIALLLPLELSAFTPLLRAAYDNGNANLMFPVVRLASCLVMIFVPAAALGATFPVAVRWYVSTSERAGSSGGALYAVNTAGAALGALAAGFVLIPSIGVTWTTRVGMLASALAMIAVVALGRLRVVDAPAAAQPAHARKARTPRADVAAPRQPAPRWLAPVVLGATGLASLIFEIAWTRVLSVTLGPTIYAFSATLAVLIGGVACGSAAGSRLAARVKKPALWLAIALAVGAIAASGASALAGGEVPLRVARDVAAAPDAFGQLLAGGAILIALLIFPTSVCFGAAFPLAFALIDAQSLGLVYAVNTIGAVAGSLAAGFFLIPHFGLQPTLTLVSLVLVLAAAVPIVFGRLSEIGRTVAGLVTVGAVAMLVFSPPWDRELLASGGYIYAPYVPKVLDLETALKAGALLYYREGATATVSVKKLTGTTSLAIDGKVDASTRSDMLTERLIAHLPLLLHEHPKDICIIGLGSGVTLGSALRHPVERADLIELSPEVVDASRYFAAENYHALNDPRTHLVVGDGRSHLLLASRKYDVIVSEPSNPWIAGVASLFTREFFAAARDRLAPGGIICQWAHTYNISNGDLRSIIATFRSVFPNGTAWMIGEEDVLLIASASPIDARLGNIERGWSRPGVAQDLATVNVREPFSLLSLYVAGPEELARYTEHATIFTDDRSSLEFSAPRELHSHGASENAASLLELKHAPPPHPTPANWHNRATMMFKSDMFTTAYDDEVRALDLDPANDDALAGLVDAAVMTGRFPDASKRMNAARDSGRETIKGMVARAKLLAASGSRDDAVAVAKDASAKSPRDAAPAAELAAIYSDGGDTASLDESVATLRQLAPDRAPTLYYAAAAAFLHERYSDAVALAKQAVAADSTYSAVYDLLGASYVKVGNLNAARDAFQSSLRFNAHDSSAYANLGRIELAAGDRVSAARAFTESLWLDPESESAHEGLLEAQTR